MKTRHGRRRSGFTLVEILAVIAIVAILAAILVPVVGSAKKTALKRRAMTEMNSIKVAAIEFQRDHRYMPWPAQGAGIYVGPDQWTTADDATQIPVMAMLTGSNAMQKSYLQLPEKARRLTDSEANPPMRFLDPWKQHYLIGLDRNLDGAVQVAGTGVAAGDGQTVMERVLVVSLGPPGENQPMKTFDVPAAAGP